MNWTMLSAIGEILSSGAILVTLIYLAIQTRQNADATQANTRQAILAADQQFLAQITDDPELYSIRAKPELTEDEKIRLSALLTTFVRMRENNWLQYQNGVLDEATWESYRGAIVAQLGSPRARIWWQNFAVGTGMFDSEFTALVDDLLKNSPARQQPLSLSVFD